MGSCVPASDPEAGPATRELLLWNALTPKWNDVHAQQTGNRRQRQARANWRRAPRRRESRRERGSGGCTRLHPSRARVRVPARRQSGTPSAAAVACASSVKRKMRDRITFETVRATLQQDEVGRRAPQVVLDFGHSRRKSSSVAPGGSGRFSLVPSAAPDARFLGSAGARDKDSGHLRGCRRTARPDRFRSRKKRRRRDARRCRRRRRACTPCLPPQQFDGDATVIEHAKTGGMRARGMMQPADGNERTARACRP